MAGGAFWSLLPKHDHFLLWTAFGTGDYDISRRVRTGPPGILGQRGYLLAVFDPIDGTRNRPCPTKLPDHYHVTLAGYAHCPNGALFRFSVRHLPNAPGFQAGAQGTRRRCAD